ncbi:hypothetical protein SUGI_1478360 [Cryptomeria japonica]|nr:hypothetical protein SUGI_1478360 [Cryptomeria japonica]
MNRLPITDAPIDIGFRYEQRTGPMHLCVWAKSSAPDEDPDRDRDLVPTDDLQRDPSPRERDASISYRKQDPVTEAPAASRPAYPFPGPVKAKASPVDYYSCCGWEKSKTSSWAKRDMASRQLSSLSVTSDKGEGSGRGFHMHGQQAWS